MIGGRYSAASDRSWMMFVDGENLTIRAQEFFRSKQWEIAEGEYYRRNAFIWLPQRRAVHKFFDSAISNLCIRSYYYTSLCGDDVLINSVRSKLWDLGFTPEVFKKSKQTEKAKGVDISLTKDMLSHAFMNHYEVAVLVSGDGDYVPVVNAVKQQGKRLICLAFQDFGLNNELKLAADELHDLSRYFESYWEASARVII